MKQKKYSMVLPPMQAKLIQKIAQTAFRQIQKPDGLLALERLVITRWTENNAYAAFYPHDKKHRFKFDKSECLSFLNVLKNVHIDDPFEDILRNELIEYFNQYLCQNTSLHSYSGSYSSPLLEA